MRRLIERDPRNAEVIFPYIGGEEVNTSPVHAHHRYVINFGERDEDECRERWPDLMAIVEAKVKPTRMQDNRVAYRRRWWQYAERRSALGTAIASLNRVLTISQVTQHVAFAFVSARMVHAHRLYVIADDRLCSLGVLQSTVHDLWSRSLGSSLEDRFMYAAIDCFETFPFPDDWTARPDLESAGRAYYDFRAALMVRNDEGLTKTYNRFHDPDETSPDIRRLRVLHAEMDRAVLAAYGWSDIPTGCEFLLDYEIDEEEWGDRRKPWRYRWPDAVRDEVLARLLELNTRRAAEEARAGATETAGARPRRQRARRSSRGAPTAEPEGNLFDR